WLSAFRSELASCLEFIPRFKLPSWIPSKRFATNDINHYAFYQIHLCAAFHALPLCRDGAIFPEAILLPAAFRHRAIACRTTAARAFGRLCRRRQARTVREELSRPGDGE